MLEIAQHFKTSETAFSSHFDRTMEQALGLKENANNIDDFDLLLDAIDFLDDGGNSPELTYQQCEDLGK